MSTPIDYALADSLKSALFNSGCHGSRKSVRYALAHLSKSERAMLAKLLHRMQRRCDSPEAEAEDAYHCG